MRFSQADPTSLAPLNICNGNKHFFLHIEFAMSYLYHYELIQISIFTKKTVLTIKKQLKFHSSWLLFFWFEDVYIHSISSKVKSLVSGMMKKQTMATKILTQEYM